MGSDVKRLMNDHGVSEEIAKRAWDACCDVEWLASEYGQIDCDPWDGDHEGLRREIESDAIRAAKSK